MNKQIGIGMQSFSKGSCDKWTRFTFLVFCVFDTPEFCQILYRSRIAYGFYG